MKRKNDNKDSFYGWIRSNKYHILLSIFCALVPFLTDWSVNFQWADPTASDEIQYLKEVFKQEIPFQIVNLIFITFALYKLTRTHFLLGAESEKEKKMHEYVIDVFKEHSTLARSTPAILFKRIGTGIKQFYYAWVCVWIIWLVMYMIKLIYSFYCINQKFMACKCYNGEFLFRIDNFLENSLNLIGSFVLFFIYMDITVSTVNIGTSTRNERGTLHLGVFLMIIIGTIIGFTDFFSIMGCSDYNLTQFYIRLFIGIIASMSIITILGRLNTSFLMIPQFFMMCLYLYAVVQMLYPVVYKIPDISDEKYYIEFIPHSLNMILNALAFFGKVTLLLVLLWIAKNNRFVFFLLHTANSHSDSTPMLRLFNKYYEGCPDK